MDVQAAIIRLGSDNGWAESLTSQADVVVVTFDSTSEKSFMEAKEIMTWVKQRNSRCCKVLACFKHNKLTIEDIVYYDIVSSEFRCQFQLLELPTCGHQLSNVFADLFPSKNKELLEMRRKSNSRFRRFRRFLSGSVSSSGSIEE